MSQQTPAEDEIDEAFTRLITQLSQGSFPPVTPITKAAPVAIYGSGGFGREMCQILQTEGFRVAAYLDRKGTGASGAESELPVYPVTSESFADLKNQGVTTVVLGVFSGNFRLDEIIDQLSDKVTGFGRVITPMELQEIFPDLLGWRYWMTPRNWYCARVQKLVDSVALWADDKSRRVYKEALLFRAGWQMARAQDPDLSHQYFPASLPQGGTARLEGLRLVDGGAYTGDTLTAFIDNGIDIEMVYAFEPDLKNFAKLSACIDDMGLNGRALLWPCGLWSSTATLSFQDNRGPSSHISRERNAALQPITVTSLDEALGGQAINLIKLDIEGAEIEALRGAQETLRRQRPDLAVCTYHHPEHLWEIAEQIQNFDLGYKLFLRNHLYNSFELVLYGLPT